MKKINIRKIVLSALFMALCMVLPLLTGQIPQIGGALSPMHIPVLLCGFICGWTYGGIVGFIAPLLRFAIFGMPPIFPTGVSMAFELAAYGVVSGLLYGLLRGNIALMIKNKRINIDILISLVIAMLAGRIVWGTVRLLIAGLGGSAFSWKLFIAGAFVNAVPGIICHIVLIPLIMFALGKARLLKED